MGWLRVIVFLSCVVFALSQDTETPKRDTQTPDEYYDVFGDKIDVETILDMAPELNEEDGSELGDDTGSNDEDDIVTLEVGAHGETRDPLHDLDPYVDRPDTPIELQYEERPVNPLLHPHYGKLSTGMKKLVEKYGWDVPKDLLEREYRKWHLRSLGAFNRREGKKHDNPATDLFNSLKHD